MSYTFWIYGLGFVSNRPIPGIPPTKIPSVDIHLYLGNLPDWHQEIDTSIQEPWYTSEFKDESGEPALRVFKINSGNHFCFSYSDGTRFVLDVAGENVWAIWSQSLTLEDTATYLLGPIMGFVLQLRGSISLHASAIVMGDKAVALVGPAGSGKSTTAAAFADRGYRVLAEDVVTLDDRGDSFLVLPAYPCIRLWPASVTALYGPNARLPKLTPNWDKCYLDLNPERYQFGDSPVSLGGIYLLGERKDDPTAPFVSPVPRSAALISLIAHTYTSYLMDKKMRARGFDLISRVLAEVPVRQVTPHTDSSHLEKLCTTIVRDFESLEFAYQQTRREQLFNV